MRRRNFMMLIGGAATALPLGATAQTSPRIYHVGLLSGGPATSDDNPFVAPLIRGLARHGYLLGRNLVFERRGAEGHVERLPQLVAELVTSKVDVIFSLGFPPTLAAKQGTTLPVVALAADPVATGLVASLARPGGNVTGISDVSAEVTAKRMELLKQIAPNLRRMAVLWNANDPGMTLRYRASEVGAKALGVSVQPLGVREPDDFDEAFAAMNHDMPDAILMVADTLTVLNRKRVFSFALAHRLPGIYEYDFFVSDGGLMSYGMDLSGSLERVAALMDRILKGARPADLPIERPTLFKFALNLTAAKAIGLEIPPTLFDRADEVFE